MAITYSSVVPAPLAEVFDWHARPGAMTRLMPPWLPVRVQSEAHSLRDGRAVLRLPGGLTRVARHEPGSYDPPHTFADRLTGGGLRWRHLHEFDEADPAAGETLMTDTVRTPVPDALLRQVFAYRHRQLADDLAAHRWGRQQRPEPLTVAVTGSSGLVGSALCAFLTSGGHRVIRLVRRDATNTNERRWHPDDPDPDLLAGVDAVVHLAGASIAGRFTTEHKRAVRDSRVGPTERLACLVAARADGATGAPTFVVASAVGFYGADRGDEYLTETSERGSGFLADVVTDWEGATRTATDAGARVVSVRTGVVQAAAGGTLPLFRALFSAGLGGRIGDGSSWLAWIGLDDLVDVYHRALLDQRLSGPVNAVAPIPVRNREFTGTLALVLHRPALMTVPPVAPRLVLGRQGSLELAEADQRVVPGVLNRLAHRFRHPQLEQTLRHQLGRLEATPSRG
jgi:hypothetical protein